MKIYISLKFKFAFICNEWSWVYFHIFKRHFYSSSVMSAFIIFAYFLLHCSYFFYWFVLYILIQNSLFSCHKYFITSIFICFIHYLDALSCRKILLYPFKFACFISCGFYILCCVSKVLPYTKIIFKIIPYSLLVLLWFYFIFKNMALF